MAGEWDRQGWYVLLSSSARNLACKIVTITPSRRTYLSPFVRHHMMVAIAASAISRVRPTATFLVRVLLCSAWKRSTQGKTRFMHARCTVQEK